MSQQAYLSHLISRLTADVDFLASQGALSPADADLVRSKLASASLSPSPSNPVYSPVGQLERQVSTLSVSSGGGGGGGRAVPPPPAPKPAALAEPAASVKRCKAKWSYFAAQADDLELKEGDVITILEETNADWWKGEFDGRTGLFPSNHVERLPDAPPAVAPQRFVPPLPARPSASSAPSFSGTSSPAPYASSQVQGYGGEKQQLQPYEHQHQQQPYQPTYYAPPPPPQQGVQYVQPEEQKKKRFGGKLGGQMANSAANGVGFGAGAAVGSGIINAIF